MAQNLAIKYSPKVAERFKAKSFTDVGFNTDYDWEGVTTVNVYSVDTVSLDNYTRSGASRYGTPAELGTTKQALTLSRDRAFTFTIDRRNRDESQRVTDAGKALAREIDEVVTPEIDVYRLAALTTAATSNSKSLATGATSSSNAYTNFLTLNESLSEDLVPVTGRVAWLTYAYYNLLKQSNFVIDSDIAQSDRKSGELGKVDDVRLIVIPASYMPTNTDLILAHPQAAVSPMILTDYITHTNAPGINGQLCEGRVVYDAFVLDAKVDAIAVHKSA